jgi:hypothetical protein
MVERFCKQCCEAREKLWGHSVSPCSDPASCQVLQRFLRKGVCRGKEKKRKAYYYRENPSGVE